MVKKYRVGIVGIGVVGTELVKVLRERDFPSEELVILARSERDEVVARHLPACSPRIVPFRPCLHDCALMNTLLWKA